MRGHPGDLGVEGTQGATGPRGVTGPQGPVLYAAVSVTISRVLEF